MTERPEIKPHTGLRGVAALLVVAYHLQFGSWYHLQIEDATMFLKRCYLLVDLFFIMSGFIISYVNPLVNPGKPVLRFWPFIARRLIRLYPMLFFTLAYFVLVEGLMTLATGNLNEQVNIVWSPISLVILLSQFLMLNAWTPLPTGWNIPSWSISAELAAYALFPLMLGLRKRSPSTAVGLLLIVPIAFYGWIAASSASLDIVSVMAPARCLAGFSLGIVIYLTRDRLQRLSAFQTNALQLIGLAGAVAVLTWSINDVAIIPAFVAIVAGTCTCRGIFSRQLSTRPMLFLGNISYSIYLNHVCLIVILRIVWDKFVGSRGIDPDLNRMLWLATSLTVVVAFSAVTYIQVELRARAYLTRRLFGVRAGPIAASPPAP